MRLEEADPAVESQGDAEGQDASDSGSDVIFESITEPSKVKKYRGKARGTARGRKAQEDAERQEDSDSDSNVIFESITESSETEKLRGKRRSTARGKKPQEGENIIIPVPVFA